jgi:hypothetical protein
MQETFIANVTVTGIDGTGWVDVVAVKDGKPYALTQFGAKGMKNLTKGTKAKLYLRETEQFSFYFLRPT